MKQTVILFISGILLALLAVGGYMVAQNYFVSADDEIIPENITISRPSPTTGLVSFTTAEPVIASIECGTNAEEEFSLCGAETQPTTNHEIRTSIILEPDTQYYFFIKIRKTTFDNLGNPFIISLPEEKEPFPDAVLGKCENDPAYNKSYDINNDGCIRGNDKILYLEQ